MKDLAHVGGKRTLAALGTGIALSMALTGCLGAGSKPAAEESAAVQQQTTSPLQTGESSERGGEDVKSAPATTQAPKEAAPAGATKLTEPGTSLKFGEVAYTHSNTGKAGSEKYKEAGYETKVTKIVAGSEADLAALKDAAKFAGQTPYYVFSEVTLTSLSKPGAGLGDPRITGHLKDGTEAQKLIVFGTMADCKTGSFDTEGKDDTFSYVVGSSKDMCSVFLAPAGDAVTTASYDDSNFSYENYKDNKYRQSPITWGK
ncbi:hypothetical protein [Arthrobacter sp.]|uniref:hypothetical protein n=1 Tax=Arthrobacter sp. TaxID=1667 RepID=UPI0026DF28F8|nr:hypothetical protein [Arthrobacter sp.]MDO5754370.1 hypothetical protein [Arthrobacter sp.]